VSKFKVGDRVAVYTCGFRYTGVVDHIYKDGFLTIIRSCGRGHDKYHPIQCRKLVRKQTPTQQLCRSYFYQAIGTQKLKNFAIHEKVIADEIEELRSSVKNIYAVNAKHHYLGVAHTAEIDALEDKVRMLEGKIDDLDSRLHYLEK
jgi:hypothetical protein